jgi:hypothetical protein
MDEATKIYITNQIRIMLVEISVGADEKFLAAGRILGYEENFIDLLERERRYRAAHENWLHYNEWKTNRNPKRAALEAKYGMDTKHAMHLCRLMTMCREILVEGIVSVRRPDAEFLRSIRDGAWSYERLMEWALQQDEELGDIAKRSALPKAPNRQVLDDLCIDITSMMQKHC